MGEFLCAHTEPQVLTLRNQIKTSNVTQRTRLFEFHHQNDGFELALRRKNIIFQDAFQENYLAVPKPLTRATPEMEWFEQSLKSAE